MGIELLRFDMSEYMEKHTVSRLIGAPPGYVGFDQGGLLTDGIDQHPHSVLLLDEIEKAHPDLFNILLQVMDHGKLTDHNGKSVDFRNVILIMTTNAGASDMAKHAIGFGRSKREGEDTEAINRMFTPEFRNRLDAVIAVRRPAARGDHQGRRQVHLPARGAARRSRRAPSSCRKRRRKWLAEKGYDEKFGARPLARVIQEYIKKPLADELLFGKLEHGGTVRVSSKARARTASWRSSTSPAIRKACEGQEPRTMTRTTTTRRRDDALVDAAPRKALPGPKERKERPPKTSGTVPNVPRRKDE